MQPEETTTPEQLASLCSREQLEQILETYKKKIEADVKDTTTKELALRLLSAAIPTEPKSTLRTAGIIGVGAAASYFIGHTFLLAVALSTAISLNIFGAEPEACEELRLRIGRFLRRLRVKKEK